MNKLMKLLFFISLFFLVSCVKEQTTIKYAYWKNKTSHTIEIRPISTGVIISNNVVQLVPNASIQIAADVERGIHNKSGFNSKYFDEADSLQVIFDNTYAITHLFTTPANFGRKYYLNTSNRNLANPGSYNYEYHDISKRQRESTYTYEFTEQDYLDAK